MPPKADDRRELPEMFTSLDEWMDTDAFRTMMEREFPDDARDWTDPVSRREFLALSGATVALAGAVGCNPSLKPASPRQLVPYVQQPVEIVPGIPLHFATAIKGPGGVGLGLLAKSTEGRPIKIEGNPSHPSSLGGTDVFAQASILGLYDPDRSQRVTEGGSASSYDKVIAAINTAIDNDIANRGEGIRILSETTTSPTETRLLNNFLDRFPSAKWIQYDTCSRDNVRAATIAAFGQPLNPVYRFDQAKVVLAIDSDFLSANGPGEVRYARDFMAGRKARTVEANLEAGDGVKPEEMKRLYAVESMFSNTGATADHRLPIKPSAVDGFVRSLAAKLGVAGAVTGELSDLARKWIDPLAEDLQAAKGDVIVIAGPEQPPAVHLLAYAINEKLGAIGKTIVFTESLEAKPIVGDNDASGRQIEDLKRLVKEMSQGKVKLLFVLGGNPAYDAPVNLNFNMALQKVPTSVHLGLYGPLNDETAALCKWHINGTHYLETWGDIKGHDGAVAIQQPLIAPLYEGHSIIDLFSDILGPNAIEAEALISGDPLDVVKSTWLKQFKSLGDAAGSTFDLWWQKVTRDGLVEGTGLQYGDDGKITKGTVDAGGVKLDALKEAGYVAAKAGEYELILRPDPTIGDGRYANNGWLQELPKAMTKLMWDNAAIVSPNTARKLGCEVDFAWTAGERGRSNVNMISIKHGKLILEKVPVWILPGHADDCITLHLGYGRERAGQTGTKRGFNAYPVRTSDNLWSFPVEAANMGDTYQLACNQGQYLMEGRRPARGATIEQFKADKEFAQIPAASAAEYKEIRALTPGTAEDFERLNKVHPFVHADHEGHVHNHDGQDHVHAAEPAEKHEEHEPHDPRIIPLSLYSEYPQKVTPPGGDEAFQAVESYRRWGMAIDLGACTGCNACVAACISENNTPVVGKLQVTKGRSMHWLRIDRYFSIPGVETMSDQLGGHDVPRSDRHEMVADSSRIRTHMQPVLCQHCEKAPCEVVCPVGATVHSADGLNDMVYNRCVGTRYCSNNCPYKVRRFNFLQYADYSTPSLKLLNNPEVTVRQRGVMEKCTYCTQRIRLAEIGAEREWATRPKDRNGRPQIFDGEIITACQSACPTQAIVFGDLNDYNATKHEGTRVLRWKAEPHNYGLLAELATMPRTSYLAAIRNPNPKMPEGA